MEITITRHEAMKCWWTANCDCNWGSVDQLRLLRNVSDHINFHLRRDGKKPMLTIKEK